MDGLRVLQLIRRLRACEGDRWPHALVADRLARYERPAPDRSVSGLVAARDSQRAEHVLRQASLNPAAGRLLTATPADAPDLEVQLRAEDPLLTAPDDHERVARIARLLTTAGVGGRLAGRDVGASELMTAPSRPRPRGVVA